jgi:hypothetical protein
MWGCKLRMVFYRKQYPRLLGLRKKAQRWLGKLGRMLRLMLKPDQRFRLL